MKKTIAVLTLAALLASANIFLASANDQTVVIGAGLGGHTFAKSDDARQGTALFGGQDEIKDAGMVELFGEWYLFDDLGIGLRRISMSGGRTYTAFAAELKQEVRILNSFITVQWVPIGSEGYTRFGLIGGLGNSTYEVSETFTDRSNPANSFEETGSTTGSATLAGIFIDWGGEDFGARFGLHSIATSLDSVEIGGTDLDVDGSGNSLYFDLRWAFD